MATPLLTTKLYVPPTRSQLVPRPRLTERMNAGSQGKLTVVSAPAGFGKTTLLSEWVRQSERPSAWVSLDEGDDELVRFLTYLITALQGIDERIGVDVQATLGAPQAPPIETLLTMLINDIAAFEGKLTLILDDCHRIDAQPIHDALDFLLDHLPENMHLVLSGRVDPLLHLSRLRVGGQLTEIRQNDLRFTKAEVAAFLNDLMGLDLSPEDIAALNTRTEGWIAALQLAALSLQGRQDTKEFIAAFSGSHYYIIDYLVDEVLSRQPKECQAFLRQTSILERFCAPLCDAVLGTEASRQTLYQLEGANLFLVPLDDERRWYRYHHLFTDFLRQRLRESEPERIPELHHRAAKLYEGNGLIPEAVDHALAAQDFDRAARLIEQIGFSLLTRSESATVSRWLEAMPEAFVRSQPWLCIFEAWMVRRAGRLDAVEQLVRDAEQALKSESATIASDADLQAIRANIATLRAYIAIFNGEISRAIELSHQALELFPPDHLIRGVTSVTLGLAYRMKGDLVRAVQAFAEARSTSQKMGNIFLTHIASWHMGYTLMLQGQMHQAINAYRESLKLASEQGKRRILYAGQPQIYIGGILCEWNELEAAMIHLTEGVELCEPTRLLDALTDGYLAIARTRLAEGDLDGARDACQDAQEALQVPNPDPVSLIRADDCRVRVWLAQGEYQEAARWVEESGLSVDDEISYKRELEHTSLARVLVALGRAQPGGSHTDDALNLLARLLEAAETAGWMGKAIEILVLQALALQVRGAEEEALTALNRALSIAEPEGYVRTFVDEGAPMVALLRRAVPRGIAPNYVSKLLTASEVETKDEGRTTETSPSSFVVRPSSLLAEPLSERECEVLRLLATELSGPEIAGELTVALSTVRYHTNNIYSKLCVHDRRAAIRRAEELSLL